MAVKAEALTQAHSLLSDLLSFNQNSRLYHLHLTLASCQIDSTMSHRRLVTSLRPEMIEPIQKFRSAEIPASVLRQNSAQYQRPANGAEL